MYAIIPPGRKRLDGHGDPDACFAEHSVKTRVSLRLGSDTYLLVYDAATNGIRNMIAESIVARAGLPNATVYGLCTLQKWTLDDTRQTVDAVKITDSDIRDLLG